MAFLNKLAEAKEINAVDVGAASVAVGAVFAILPGIASILSIIWFGLRIWESDTVRAYTNRERTHGKDDE